MRDGGLKFEKLMDVVYLRWRGEGGRRELRGRWRESPYSGVSFRGFPPFCRRVNEPTYLDDTA